jgi:hypothetical protein
MTQWFRFYGEAINDPKILKLPEVIRWRWVAVLSAASKHEGKIPAADDLALMLRITMQQTIELITILERAKLIDKTKKGYTPHNWPKFQYKSDVSTDRVKKHRNKKRNVSETFHVVAADVPPTVAVTPPETETEADTETETEADTETDQKQRKEGTREVALVPSDWPTDFFDQFWKKYPNKVDPKGSKKKLAKAGNSGIDFKIIMDGLDRYVAKTDDRPWCNPTTWINQARWNEQHAEIAPHGKAKTGGSIIDALRDLGDHFDQQADAERAARDDSEARGDDVLGLLAE